MTKYWPSQVIPRPNAWQGFARNTLPVMGWLGKSLQMNTNHCVAYRRKLVASKCLDVNAIAAGLAGTNELWHGQFHAGYGAQAMIAVIGMAPVDNSSSVDGEVYLTIGGTDTNKLHQVYTAGSDIADDFVYGRIVHGVTQNTNYNWSLTAVDYARPFAIGLWEIGAVPVDTANGGTVSQDVGSAIPILDSQHGGLAAAHWDLWKRNSKHLFEWSRDALTTAARVSGASYFNIFDGSSGGAGGSIASVNVVVPYDDRVNHDVAIRFSVKCSTDAGAGAVRLVDDTNTTLAEITGIGTTDQWYKVDATLTAGTHLVTVEAKATAGQIISLDAVSLYSYLT